MEISNAKFERLQDEVDRIASTVFSLMKSMEYDEMRGGETPYVGIVSIIYDHLEHMTASMRDAMRGGEQIDPICYSDAVVREADF